MEHKIRVEFDRCRVVCLGCPWFHHDASLTIDELRHWGRGHQHAAKPR